MNNVQLWGNQLQDWLMAGGMMAGVLLVLIILKYLVKNRLLRAVRDSATEVDDFLVPIVRQTRVFTFLALGLYLGSLFLDLPPRVEDPLEKVLRVVAFLQIGFWGMGMISFYVNREVSGKLERDSGEAATTIDAFGLVAKIGLWVVISLLILDNLGVQVSSLVASLGIGGIAVALAVQNMLEDLFASLSIALDKPFVIGDFIVIDEYSGNVEDIGLKSTRIRSLSGEELVFSNADLLNSRIRNYKRLQTRRIEFHIGVVYGTPAEKLARIPEIVEEIISPIESVQFDRAHFDELGDYALMYEIIYLVEQPDYATYMDVQEEINLGLYQRFEEEGIEFAYPTQTLFLEQ
jgi:small-conductance mechanosensitive channel